MTIGELNSAVGHGCNQFWFMHGKKGTFAKMGDGREVVPPKWNTSLYFPTKPHGWNIQKVAKAIFANQRPLGTDTLQGIQCILLHLG